MGHRETEKTQKGIGESVDCKIDRQARHTQKLGDAIEWFEGNISSKTKR